MTSRRLDSQIRPLKCLRGNDDEINQLPQETFDVKYYLQGNSTRLTVIDTR